jgi:processive 1,2-diacylglycerol beta-glucosyltransferase
VPETDRARHGGKPAGSRPRILLLSASAGAGHVRAAQAVEKAFGERGECDVEHVDVLDHCSFLFRFLFRDFYQWMTARTPLLMEHSYASFNTPGRNPWRRRMFSRVNTLSLERFLRRWKPDVCLSTHFLPAEVVARLQRRGALRTKNAVVLTDLDVHALWVYPEVARYYVSLPEAAAYLERLGVAADKIARTGIPVDPGFSQAMEQREARRALGLDPGRFTVLVTAGVYASTPIENLVRDLLAADFPWQIVAVVSRSETLRQKLSALEEAGPGAARRLFVVGFTTEMDRWMAAADILVGKAGGLTVSEALAVGLPLAILEPIPGVETRNADHLLEQGAAIRIHTPETAAWKIRHLAADPERLAAMRAAARALGRPRAAAAIAADCIQQLTSLGGN